MEFRSASIDWMDRVSILACERDHGTGSTGSGGALHLPSKDALMAWLANLEIKV